MATKRWRGETVEDWTRLPCGCVTYVEGGRFVLEPHSGGCLWSRYIRRLPLRDGLTIKTPPGGPATSGAS